jgi:hypothetical protein
MKPARFPRGTVLARSVQMTKLRSFVTWGVLSVSVVACGSNGNRGLTFVDGGAGHPASGSDGAAGAGGAEDAGGAEVSPCGAHLASSIPYVSTAGPSGGSYEGPAVVERSTSKELTLTFTLPMGVAGALPLHATISGLGATPLFTPGAKVWLKKNPAGDPSRTSPFGPVAGQSFSVYDKSGGRLLFGASDRVAGVLPSVPAANECTAPYDDGCGTGTITYRSTEVLGDSSIVIADAETRVVPVGGFDYDVTVTWRTFDVAASSRCADYFGPPGGMAMDVRARDLASLASKLATVALPVCARGNADQPTASFTLFEVSTRQAFEGPVVYVKRGRSSDTECFQFDPTSLPHDKPPVPMLEICVSPGLFKEPAVGQTLWASVPSYVVATLRTAQTGPLLLAAVNAIAGDPSAQQAIAPTLGVGVETRSGCAYALDEEGKETVRLQDLVFATTPPVVVASDTRSVVAIAGKDYDVWVTGLSGYRLTLAPH